MVEQVVEWFGELHLGTRTAGMTVPATVDQIEGGDAQIFEGGQIADSKGRFRLAGQNWNTVVAR